MFSNTDFLRKYFLSKIYEINKNLICILKNILVKNLPTNNY